MTNIQIMFFCGLSGVFIATMFLLLWKVHRVNVRISNLEKSYKEDFGKLKELSNKIYEKLKEVVEKVNPLLASATSSTNKNEDIVEVEYAPVEEDAVIVDGE